MNSFGHLVVSIAKSTMRIVACIYSLLDGTVWLLAAGFLVAEVLGIVEELVDKR